MGAQKCSKIVTVTNLGTTEMIPKLDFFLDKVFCCTDVIPQVLHKDQNQNETKLSLADYTNRFCSHDRLVKGQLEYAKWSEVLDKIEEDFGVPATVLLALWGIETNYGTVRGDISTLSALATRPVPWP